ncbi:MAG TPA: pyridoxal phosphate-dependent aminotransferase [Firmicutes bacterium]|nr:pyridoxal phosphate-dependent aminotransferase [Candidatus Fermentithermobacillaceae bacterium]
MKYDFDTWVDRRGTNCSKWDTPGRGLDPSLVLPMSIADMDFPVPEPVIEALRKRVDHPVYGYTNPGEGVTGAVIDRLERKFDWRIRPEWLSFSSGVVPSLTTAVRALTEPGEKVLAMSPVYPHLPWAAPRAGGREAVFTRLKTENGRYVMDLNDIERALAEHKPKVIMLCSPHNPGGRLWTREELLALGGLALKYDAYVVSDEIHCELVLSSRRHVPFPSLSSEIAARSIVLMSPAKTFNVAGLGTSLTIIPDAEVRKRFLQAEAGVAGEPNIFGLTALEAAYRHGDEWLEQVLEYIRANLSFLTGWFNKELPQLKVMEPEATYLVWVDCRGLGLDNEALSLLFREKAKVAVVDGFKFGEGGEGFVRLNIACPRSILEEGLRRIASAIRGL